MPLMKHVKGLALPIWVAECLAYEDLVNQGKTKVTTLQSVTCTSSNLAKLQTMVYFSFNVLGTLVPRGLYRTLQGTLSPSCTCGRVQQFADIAGLFLSCHASIVDLAAAVSMLC
jgi:hypothetical protein